MCPCPACQITVPLKLVLLSPLTRRYRDLHNFHTGSMSDSKTLDDRLRDLVDTLADRLRREAGDHLQQALAQLQESAPAERAAAGAQAARGAREAAEHGAAERLARAGD